MTGAAAGARKWGWSLYASDGTVDAWPELQEANCARVAPGAGQLAREIGFDLDIRRTPVMEVTSMTRGTAW